MKTRVFPHTGLLAGFMIILLFLSSLPWAFAAPPTPSQGPGAAVSGVVEANGVPVSNEYVWVAPRDALGNLDYQNARETWTDVNGVFAFTNMPMGHYSMDIE